MLGYIRDTTTETGLKVKAFLLDREYSKGSSIFNFALLVYTPPAITMLEEATE
jgi:hypothetical protein